MGTSRVGEPGPSLYPECGRPGWAGAARHRKEGTRTCAACREACRVASARSRVNRYVSGPRRIPALGSQRRIRALMRVGWSQREVSRRLGVRFSVVSRMLTQQTVFTETAEKLTQVYGQLAWETGPSARTRALAVRSGWPGPMDWDDPDNPDEIPACEIEKAHREALVMDASWRRREAARRETPEQREARLRTRREQRRRREGAEQCGR